MVERWSNCSSAGNLDHWIKHSKQLTQSKLNLSLPPSLPISYPFPLHLSTSPLPTQQAIENARSICPTASYAQNSSRVRSLAGPISPPAGNLHRLLMKHARQQAICKLFFFSFFPSEACKASSSLAPSPSLHSLWPHNRHGLAPTSKTLRQPQLLACVPIHPP